MVQRLNGKDIQDIACILANTFSKKIQHIWIMTSDKEKARHLIQNHLNSNQCIVERLDGKVVGVCSIETKTTQPFIDIPRDSFHNEFGFAGGTWRFLAYQIYKATQGTFSEEMIHIDLLAVNPSTRGKGAGKSLLNKVETLAARIGKSQLVLEVVDSNPQAKSLYERQGFQTRKYDKMNLLFNQFTKRAGFKGFYTMTKEIKKKCD